MKVLIYLSPGMSRNQVMRALTAREHVVETVISAEGCMRAVRSEQYEAVLVEVQRENHGQALVLVNALRHGQPAAALFVFERNLDLHQRLQLFDAGADDCIRERFFASEFAMRLMLSIRLRQAASKPVANVSLLHAGDLELDLVRRSVARQGKQIDLRPKEFLLLEYLMRNANRPVTRSMILEHVWHSSFEGLTNVVDVYISTLRTKIDGERKHKLIQTNRGVGYTLRCQPLKQPCDGNYSLTATSSVLAIQP
jgi:two-component system OmpR family response regulator